jgi:cytoskeletal protein RodZ
MRGQTADGDGEPRLGVGASLAALREQRGISPAEVIKQSPIPEYYFRMIEKNDYSTISDPLYLLPFVRRYASFLALDAEEIAARFVREAERDYKNSPEAKSSKSRQIPRRKDRRWLRVALALATIGLMFLAAYIFESRRLAGRSIHGRPVASAKTLSAASASALVNKPLMVIFEA